MKRLLWLVSWIFLFGVVVGTAHAALISTPEYIIDDCTGLYWVGHMNYALKDGHDSDGHMTWMQAQDFAHDLVYGREGYNDWRLPTIAELTHLYVAEGIRWNDDPFWGWQLCWDSPAPWTLAGKYWSGDTLLGWGLNVGDVFDIRLGDVLLSQPLMGEFHAVAVRQGTVPEVPVPGTVWMLGSGLAGFGLIRRNTGRRH